MKEILIDIYQKLNNIEVRGVENVSRLYYSLLEIDKLISELDKNSGDK